MEGIESTLAVHEAGYPVVLVPAGKKGPRTKGWPDTRYTRDELHAKLLKDSTRNVGILLGPESGVIDIECDGPTAPADLAELFGGPPPETPSWQSSRGAHYLFIWDDRLLKVNKATIKFGGVEIRLGCGKAAQSLIPPSTTNGFTRAWIVPLNKDNRPATLPDAVIEKIIARKQVDPGRVAKTVEWLKPLQVTGTREEDGYVVIDLAACPWKGQHDGHSGVLVFDDGTIMPKCFHAKCGERTLADLEALIGPYDGPRTIIVSTDEKRTVDQAVAALAVSNTYQRGGLLVRIAQNAPPPPGISRAPDSPRIEALPQPTLRETLAASAKWVRMTDDGPTRCHVPSWVVSAVAARGSWPVPTIEAVASVPLLRADGTILDAPGFDAATGVFYAPTIDYPAMPTVEDAIALLLETVCDFPFATDAHRAAWVAAAITPFARLAFSGPSPVFAVDAPTPGSGKGLLCDVTSTFAAGREMAKMAAANDDAEWRKRITAIAIAGDPIVLIDNIDGRLGSPALDAALTATTWADRLLGTNETVCIPLAATWYATGNNILFARDTARRTLHIRLECPVEKPEERTDFRHKNLLAWVRENRGRLAMSALAILKGYFDAGRPDQNLPAWGSFDGWSDLVRQAVVWAGLPDPGTTRLALAETADTDLALLRQLIVGWQAADPHNEGLTVALALEIASEGDEAVAPLRAAIAEIGGRDMNQSLGNALKKYRGRIVDGWQFISPGLREGRKTWKVAAAAASPPKLVCFGSELFGTVYDHGCVVLAGL